MVKHISAIVLFTFYSAVCLAQKASNNRYDYPVDPKTDKITYTNTIQVNGNKMQLFKRAQQFLALQDFGRIVEIKTHTGSQRNAQIVKDPVTYSDAEDGKIFGNGFFDFKYRGHNYFLFLFNYKIYTRDGQYKYVLTNFTVKELWDAGGGKVSRSMGMRQGTFVEDSKTKIFPLEEFLERKAYKRSNELFVEKVSELKRNLKLAMLDEL
jgi:hypothetical protein